MSMAKLTKLTIDNIPDYGLRTWLFGGQKVRDPNNDDERDINAIRMHLDNGVKQIFTAQNYADGWTEKLVGQAIKDYDRSKVMLNTAIRKEMSAYDDVFRALDESLERLQTDYVDVIVHHAPIPEVPIKDTIKALNKILDRGLARGLAVSNYNSKSMSEALNHTSHPILFNQVYYNLFVREIEEEEVKDLCLKNDVLIQAFRPLEQGELTKLGIPQLDKIANKYEASPAQISLSWLTSQEGVVVISTTHNKDHLRENLEGISIKMKPEDIEFLRDDFPTKKLDREFIR